MCCWDGKDSEVLIGQNYLFEDDLVFIVDLVFYLCDFCYICIDGKVLVMVYCFSLLFDLKVIVECWWIWCCDNGVGEIYLVYIQFFEFEDLCNYGFDVVIEFLFNNVLFMVLIDWIKDLDLEFIGIVYDWNFYVDCLCDYLQLDYWLICLVCLVWDNMV